MSDLPASLRARLSDATLVRFDLARRNLLLRQRAEMLRGSGRMTALVVICAP